MSSTKEICTGAPGVTGVDGHKGTFGPAPGVDIGVVIGRVGVVAGHPPLLFVELVGLPINSKLGLFAFFVEGVDMATSRKERCNTPPIEAGAVQPPLWEAGD